MTAGRWLCQNCGHRFAEPVHFFYDQVIKYKCPSCGSGNLVGAANSDPFTPKQVKRK